MNDIVAGCIGMLSGLLIGFIIGRCVKNSNVRTFYDYLNSVFKNLENYVLGVSGLLVVVSIILSVTEKITIMVYNYKYIRLHCVFMATYKEICKRGI